MGFIEGHVGDGRAARKGPSSPSNGNYAVTVLFRGSGAPGAIAGVGVKGNHKVAGGHEKRRSIERQMGGEGASNS